MNTISADKAKAGERVTLDFHEGGYGVAFEVDGTLYGSPGGLDEAFEVSRERSEFDLIRDGGKRYDDGYAFDVPDNARGPALDGR